MRPLAPALALALLLGAGIALAPTALAEEDTFSHRYVVYGRVVDAAGHAVKDVLVDVGLDAQLGPPEDCPINPAAAIEALGTTRTQRRTGETGDFIFCFHVHEIPADVGTGAVRIDEGEFAAEFPMDPDSRVSFLNLQLRVPLEGRRTFALNSSYMVMGRLWHPVPNGTVLDDVAVRGLPRADTEVGITLDVGGIQRKGTTRTNAFGDFAVQVPVPARPIGGSVVLVAEGRSMTLPVDRVTAMTPFSFELPPPRGLPAAAIVAIAFGGVALIAAVAWSVARRATNR